MYGELIVLTIVYNVVFESFSINELVLDKKYKNQKIF